MTTHSISCSVGAIVLSLLLAGCGSSYPPLDVVPNVDLQRYAGKWYEIASLPVSQQKGCFCTTAEYSLDEDGVVRVINTCRKNGPNGEIDRVEGKAFLVPNSNNAKFRVQFFWPFRGDYWVLELDPEYRYAVVGVPSRKYVWILCREPRMDPALLDQLTEKIRVKGFDVKQMQRTSHTCSE